VTPLNLDVTALLAAQKNPQRQTEFFAPARHWRRDQSGGAWRAAGTTPGAPAGAG